MVVSTRSAASDAGPKTGLEAFPPDYPAAIQQMQGAVQAALADGATLLEIEFPTSGLASVAGDGEGANEMTNSLRYMRQFCRIFQDRANRVRIFFPDDKAGVPLTPPTVHRERPRRPHHTLNTHRSSWWQ